MQELMQELEIEMEQVSGWISPQPWCCSRPSKVQVGQEVMLIGVKLQFMVIAVCSWSRRASHQLMIH